MQFCDKSIIANFSQITIKHLIVNKPFQVSKFAFNVIHSTGFLIVQIVIIFLDGEHLETKEEDQHLEGEDHGTETGLGSLPQGNDEGALDEGDHPISTTGGEGYPSDEASALHEDATNYPEEPSESAEGFSALEGALFGGFWVAWALYSLWDS